MNLAELTEDQILALAQDPKALKDRARRIMEERKREVAEKQKREAAEAHRERIAKMHEGRDKMHVRGRRPVGVEWFDALTEQEQLLEIARANLAAYGSIVPPTGAQLAVLDKKCGNCGKTKNVLQGFGVRTYKNGTMKAQGWCRDCRAQAGTASKQKKRGE